MPIHFDAKAQSFARATGLDTLGQATLKKLDHDGDGVVTLRAAKALAKEVGLDHDGVLTQQDRKAIRQVLGAERPATPSVGRSSGPSSAVAIRAGDAKKNLPESYLEARSRCTKAGLELSLSADDPKGAGTRATRTITLDSLSPTAVDLLPYAADGSTGMPNSSGGGHMNAFGAGLLVAVADARAGVALVDLAAQPFVTGQAPPQRTLFSRDDVLRSDAVKGEARRTGLDPKKLTVDVKDIWLSAGYKDSTTNTLAFHVKISDGKKSRSFDLSTVLEGNLAKSLTKLSTSALEVGVVASYGWLYPPSIKDGADKSSRFTSVTDGGAVSRGGGAEGPSNRSVRGGGAEGLSMRSVRGGGRE